MNELISAPATWTASMESPESEHGNLWAIVLAGGEGVRLRSLTRRLYGDDRPKQYAALVGARSLLRQTLDRVSLLIPPERTVVVTLASHEVETPSSRRVPATRSGVPRSHHVSVGTFDTTRGRAPNSRTDREKFAVGANR